MKGNRFKLFNLLLLLGLLSTVIFRFDVIVSAGTIQEILVSGIRSQNDQFLFDPQPQTSKYLKTFQGGFYVSKYGARYYCLWDIITKDRDKNLYVRMELEDPLHKKQPIIQEGVIEPTAQSLHVAYGPIKGLKMYGFYQIRLYLYDDEAKTELIDQLTQNIKSYVDTRKNRLLIDNGLVTADGQKLADIIGRELDQE